MTKSIDPQLKKVHDEIETLRQTVRRGKFLDGETIVQQDWMRWRRTLSNTGGSPASIERIQMATLAWEVYDALGQPTRAGEYLLKDGLRSQCESQLQIANKAPSKFREKEFPETCSPEEKEGKYNLWRQKTVWTLARGFQHFRHQQYDDAISILLVAEKFLDVCMVGFTCHGTRSRLYYFQGQVRQAEEKLADAATLFDKSLRSCFARLKERSDKIPPGSPRFDVERSFAYYGLGKLELRMGELDYEQGRLQSALRHAYAGRSLLQTTEDPFLLWVAELLLCRIERARERLGKHHWKELLPRIDECYKRLDGHTAFRFSARIEQLTTKVYLLHHAPVDESAKTETQLRNAAYDLETVAKEAQAAELPRTAFRAALSKAETLMRVPDLPAAHLALSAAPSPADSETMTAQVEFLRGKIFQAGKQWKRAMACFQRARKLHHESLVFQAYCHLHILELCVAQRRFLKAKELIPLLRQTLATIEPGFIHKRYKEIEKKIDKWNEMAFRFTPDFDPIHADLEMKDGFLRYLSGLAEETSPKKLSNANVWRLLTQRHPNIRVKKRDVERWLESIRRSSQADKKLN